MEVTKTIHGLLCAGKLQLRLSQTSRFRRINKKYIIATGQ